MKALVPSLTLLLALLPGVASPQWNQLGQDIDGQAVNEKSGISVALSADGSRVAIGAPYEEPSAAGVVRIYDWDSAVGAWVLLGSEIRSLDPGSYLGKSVSLSADGSRVAIGIPSLGGTGTEAGQVRVFDWIDPNWVQVGPFGIPGEASGDHSGMSVSLSADGSQVAIGATQNGDNGSDSGHVRVYRWISPDWVQRGSDIDGEAAGDESGSSVSLSADGSRVAIGAHYADGINGSAGHVRVYQYNGYPIRDWLQVGQDIDGEAVHDSSGRSVALSADGSRVAIGAPLNGGNGHVSGHVRVFSWLSPNWVRVGQDIDGEAAGDYSGFSVALSADGFRVAIGSPKSDENGDLSGQVRAYQYRGYPIEDWLQVGEDIDGEAAGDGSGESVALSSGGTRVAIGAPYNQGNGSSSGHVRVYSTEEIFADGFESGDTSAW